MYGRFHESSCIRYTYRMIVFNNGDNITLLQKHIHTQHDTVKYTNI